MIITHKDNGQIRILMSSSMCANECIFHTLTRKRGSRAHKTTHSKGLFIPSWRTRPDLPVSSLVLRLLLLLERYRLPDIGPEAQGRIDAGLVGVDLRALPHQIGLLGLHELGALDQLEGDPEDDVDEAHGVVGEEGAGVEGVEDGVAVDGKGDGEEDDAGVGDVRLAPAFVGELIAVEALRFHGSVEEDVDGAHDDVVHELGGLRDVC